MSEYVNSDGSISPGSVPEIGGRALSSSNPMPAAPMQGSVIDRSAMTVAAVSTILMGANPARRKWFVAAPQTADLWLNLAGGPAAVGGPGCYRVPAGGSAGSAAGVVETGAISYYCANASLQIAAYEV